MISKTDAQRAAETLISMCTDFLMGGLSQDVFASNLTLFAQRLDPKAAHAINQHEKLVEACRKALSYLPAKDGKRTGDPDGDVQLMICNELAALLDEEKP